MRNYAKMERKLRMIESKLNRLAEEVNDDESPEFWDRVEDILDSEGYNRDIINWVIENSSDIIKDGSVEKTPEEYAYAISDYIESFDPEEFLDMVYASEYNESRRPRGRMLKEDEENTNKKYKIVNEPPYCSATVLLTTDDYDEAIELIKEYAKKHSGVYKVIDAETGKKLAEEWNDYTWWSISHDNS